jgi:hypothetical protein
MLHARRPFFTVGDRTSTSASGARRDGAVLVRELEVPGRARRSEHDPVEAVVFLERADDPNLRLSR